MSLYMQLIKAEKFGMQKSLSFFIYYCIYQCHPKILDTLLMVGIIILNYEKVYFTILFGHISRKYVWNGSHCRLRSDCS